MQTAPESAPRIDRVNIVLALLVFLGSLIVYAMTVQRTFSFWDCGEFIASAYTLGIPHPPGFPLYILLGRVFSMIPLIEDISHRVNYLSVISSAFTAMWCYLLTVRIARYFFSENTPQNRLIGYIGGIAGGFFVAFSATNWANSVEAEVYGLSLALMALICWLTVRFFETRGTGHAAMIAVLVSYLALLGVGIHLTVFLVVPFCAVFFILKPEASAREYMLVSVFVILELFLIIFFSNGRGGVAAFYLVSALAALGLVALVHRHINWGVAIAIVSISSIMVGFKIFLYVAAAGLLLLLVLALVAQQGRYKFNWQLPLAIMIAGYLGFSVHMYVPIRSSLDPSIDMNNPSQSFQTFIDFLERKQYGQQSMVDRMFQRRGTWNNQFGRHPHMGFWSYFEQQYSPPGVGFLPFLFLGLLGMYVAIRKRLELGLPYLTLFLVCSVGLVLYMNFADGTLYNAQTGDAYLEVRERDYFFTPAFVFFGVAMGMGVAGGLAMIREWLAKAAPSAQKAVVYASVVLVGLPVVSLARNYHHNDRSESYLPWIFGANLLDTCEENGVLFTVGDNETYPVWCLQEVYGYRSDVTAVNLSLLNLNWYVEQRKNHHGLPISLDDDQIVLTDIISSGGEEYQRPARMFLDRPRGMQTYLVPHRGPDGGTVTVADMIVDDIVINNRWRRPLYFSSLPPGSSPLKLRDHAEAQGLLFHLSRENVTSFIDVDRSYDLFTEKYDYRSLGDPGVYRDPGVSRDFVITIGVAAVRNYEGLIAAGDTARAVQLMEKMVDAYPQYWQAYTLLAYMSDQKGDTAGGDQIIQRLYDTISAFHRASPDNTYFLQDLGMATYEQGRRQGRTELVEEGLRLMKQAFEANPNDVYAFRKLATSLDEQGRNDELRLAAQKAAEYKRNLGDPILQQALRTGRVLYGR